MKAVSEPINVMLMEDDRVGDLLKEIRELKKDYEVLNDRCQSFKLLYKKFKILETDTHLFIHKENNIFILKLNLAN
jgi:regulator of cell morphogenesis and NO signaling